jgi:hypothetical protein
MNLSKYGFPYLGDGSEKWRSYPHIVPKNLDAIALAIPSDDEGYDNFIDTVVLVLQKIL